MDDGPTCPGNVSQCDSVQFSEWLDADAIVIKLTLAAISPTQVITGLPGNMITFVHEDAPWGNQANVYSRNYTNSTFPFEVVDAGAVPEPSVGHLAGLGLMLLGARHWYRRRKR